MSDNRTTPKTKRSIVRLYIVRISVVQALAYRSNVWISAFYSIKQLKMTEIRTFERPCLAFGRKKMTEIRTFRSDFGHFQSLELYLNRTIVGCPKSKLFRFRTLTVQLNYGANSL